MICVNLVLFEPHEVGQPLRRSDRRAAHLADVLRRKIGDTFDAGVINGPRGKATLTAISADTLEFTFTAHVPAAAALPATLIVGLPRPQTARDILRDATTLGVAALHFVRTDKAESSYAQSTLWSSGEWRRHVIAGAEQAFDTRIPEVTHGRPLRDILADTRAPDRLALDNYEAAQPLAHVALPRKGPVAIAIGSERGWSAAERDLLREHGFQFVHLGSRVLRTETAVIAALTLIQAKIGR